MALRNIIKAPDELLRKKSRPVDKIDQKILTLLDDMAETMYAADGVGLAAPQVGVSRRIVVIDVGEGLIELINPVITKREGSVVGGEGCLSVPNFEGEVERAEYIECEFFDRKGKRMKLASDGILAIAVQHELDHLDGILFIDKATVLTPKETVPVGIE